MGEDVESYEWKEEVAGELMRCRAEGLGAWYTTKVEPAEQGCGDVKGDGPVDQGWLEGMIICSS